MKTEKSNPLSA